MQRWISDHKGDQAPNELRSWNRGKGGLLGYKLLIPFQKQNTIIVSVGETCKESLLNPQLYLSPILANEVN